MSILPATERQKHHHGIKMSCIVTKWNCWLKNELLYVCPHREVWIYRDKTRVCVSLFKANHIMTEMLWLGYLLKAHPNMSCAIGVWRCYRSRAVHCPYSGTATVIREISPSFWNSLRYFCFM